MLRSYLRMSIILPLIFVIGCSPPPDERLVELSRQSCERQAGQNAVIARQTRQATELSGRFLESEGRARQELLELQQQLVEADAAAREELIQIQQDLVQRDAQAREDLNALQEKAQAASAAERSSLDRQHEDLENERRQIARERQRAPVIAAAITQLGLILACLAPLALCAYLLWSLRSTAAEDEAVTELLVEELTSERPRLLLPEPPPAAQPALSNHAGPAGTKETGSDVNESSFDTRNEETIA